MSMRVLVIGGTGQLGKDLLRELSSSSFAVDAPPHDKLDITFEKHVVEYLKNFRPNVVINTAAFHHVSKCEQQPSVAFSVNALGPRNIARACRQTRAKFFHISTDFVFDGNKQYPYVEDDVPKPSMVFGATKLAGENLAMNEWKNTYIVRTSSLFGNNQRLATPQKPNFVEQMLSLAATQSQIEVSANVHCSPTYTSNLARQLVVMMETELTPGVYHATNGKGCSWLEFANMIFVFSQMRVKLIPIDYKSSSHSFHRPLDTRLANQALNNAIVNVMKPLSDALTDYLQHRTIHSSLTQEGSDQ